jgi:tRNA-modifying protein YgfZ
VSGLAAARTTCVVADRSDLGRLLATGPDLLGLLQRLSTGDVKNLGPGQGCETVVTNAKGRIVERLFVHNLGPEGVLLVAGPHGAPAVQAHLKKFTFAEDTGLSDVTATTFAYALFGPKWAEAADGMGIPELAPYGSAKCTIAGSRVHVVRNNGFNAIGALVIGPRDDASQVRDALVEAAEHVGGGPVDADVLDAWRILSGFPASGRELTEDYNPLEAGLRDAVSFTKGCYVGQEVVARLNTYGKVSRALIVLEFEPGVAAPVPGSAILHAGVAIGSVTSGIGLPGQGTTVALGYVKTRELPDGINELSVDVDGALRRARRIAS